MEYIVLIIVALQKALRSGSEVQLFDLYFFIFILAIPDALHFQIKKEYNERGGRCVAQQFRLSLQPLHLVLDCQFQS